jgi:hypothetical protein
MVRPGSFKQSIWKTLVRPKINDFVEGIILGLLKQKKSPTEKL